MRQCYLGPGKLADLERWLPNTVTIFDVSLCTSNMQITYFLHQLAAFSSSEIASPRMKYGMWRRLLLMVLCSPRYWSLVTTCCTQNHCLNIPLSIFHTRNHWMPLTNFYTANHKVLMLSSWAPNHLSSYRVFCGPLGESLVFVVAPLYGNSITTQYIASCAVTIAIVV